MLDTPTESQDPHEDPCYVYKPAMFGAPREFWLRPDGLEWCAGRTEGRIPYDKIKRVRLSFRPVTLQSHRFSAEIWPVSGGKLEISSASWKSAVEQERFDGPYRAFILELHRRMAEAGTCATFEAGSSPWLYWPGVAVFIATSLGLAALTARALQIESYGGAAFVGIFLGLFLWQVGKFFKRNKPGSYTAHSVPDDILPRG